MYDLAACCNSLQAFGGALGYEVLDISTVYVSLVQSSFKGNWVHSSSIEVREECSDCLARMA